MEIIKRRISANIGDLIHMKIPLTQTIENIGLMTDIPSVDISQNDEIRSRFYKQGDIVNYSSDSKLEVVRTYDDDNKYIPNFDTKKESYTNFNLEEINGVDRVVNINGNQITYTVNARRDSLIGTTGQTTGIQYIDNPIEGVTIPNELDVNSTTTKVQYYAEGWNETNTSAGLQIQEEYLLGIISQPEVKSDVFIDRTTFSVLDKHLRLSEIESLEHLTKYGNGFYNINRD